MAGGLIGVGGEIVRILTRAEASEKALVEPAGRWETRRVQNPHTVTAERPAEHRRHTRVAASWPVTVRSGDRLLHLQTLNLSPLGVKVGLDEPLPNVLEVGRAARLRLEPPGSRPVEVEAIVWRADDDGPAFFFLGTPFHAEPAHAE
jgi:PilZ domain